MPALELLVKLPDDRSRTGTLAMIEPSTGLPIFGPVPVLGQAAQNTATAAGNPARLATRRYGHTPTGTYAIPAILCSGAGTAHPAEAYGRVGVIRMVPTGGEAEIARVNGRTGLLIHAGRQPETLATMPSHLRSTNGCLRMLERDLAALIAEIASQAATFPGNVVVTVGPAGPRGTDDPDVNDRDPPPIGSPPLLP